MSRVGARTAPSLAAARSGRPPRETTAAIWEPGSAAAHRAAPAPVLARSSRSGRSPCRPAAQPVGRRDQPPGEQLDVEDVRAVPLLLGGEQVDEQRAQPGLVEHLGDVAVAWAVAAAAAAVREDDDCPGSGGHGEVTLDRHGPGGNDDVLVRVAVR